MGLTTVLSATAQASLARTPPMGWNGWNHFFQKVTHPDAPDAMVTSALEYGIIRSYDL